MTIISLWHHPGSSTAGWRGRVGWSPAHTASSPERCSSSWASELFRAQKSRREQFLQITTRSVEKGRSGPGVMLASTLRVVCSWSVFIVLIMRFECPFTCSIDGLSCSISLLEASFVERKTTTSRWRVFPPEMILVPGHPSAPVDSPPGCVLGAGGCLGISPHCDRTMLFLYLGKCTP